MAAGFDVSALTLNPKEMTEFQKFVIEQIFMKPELLKLHTVWSGVKMKEQIVLASQLGKTGIKATTSCTRKNSGAKSTMTEKFWEPAGIEDTIVHCNAEIDALFKAYFDKIQSYKEKYDITGSDAEVFLTILLEEAANSTVWRAIWFADLNVAAAGAGAAGLVDAADVKFYDYFDGIWAQVFDGVTAGDISRYTIALNTNVTPATQMAVTTTLAKTYLDAMWNLADPRLKAHPDAKFYVSGMIWDMYAGYLQEKGENFSIDFTQNGFSTLKYKGKEVINMETIWDVTLFADFYNNTVNQAYYLPNRALFTIPANIPVGTLNENDFTELEMWYEKKDRTNNLAYGFSLDSKVLEPYLVVAAY